MLQAAGMPAKVAMGGIILKSVLSVCILECCLPAHALFSALHLLCLLVNCQPPVSCRHIQWLLLDGMTGGSGEPLDWCAIRPPKNVADRGWLLAGGLNPGNVAEAIRTARPTAVDVASGVCGPDGIAKDSEKIQAFIQAVRDTQTVAA